MKNFYSTNKIDAHVHVFSQDSALLQQAQEDNFKLLSINVDCSEFPSLDEQHDIAIKHLRAFSDHFAFATTFSMDGFDEPGWQTRVIRKLDENLQNGAIAVKVWKNIGMVIRDTNNKWVMIDDPRFDEIFGHLMRKKVVVIGHQGEPKNCWLPIEKISINFEREYYQKYPHYHAYLHPELPSYEEQIAARDGMLEKNRRLVFVGAHFASLEWDIEELGLFLDRYPKAVVDTAERMMYLQYHSIYSKQNVRDFVVKYQDRILYGTDIIHSPGADPAALKEQVHHRWLQDWKYFVTDATMQSPEFEGSFQGLALPEDVVDKIYWRNAARTYSRAWKG